MKYNFLLTLIVFAFILHPLKAGERPNWTFKEPKGYTNDYFVGWAVSRISEFEAIQSARANAVGEVLKSRRIKASIDEKLITVAKEQSGTINNSQQNIDYSNKIIIRGNETLENLFEDENYTEYSNGEFHAWSLVKTPKLIPSHDSPPTSSDYIARSFIPGWAQYYKGQSTKGFMFASGEAVFVASGIIFAALKIDRENQISPIYAQAVNDDYQNQANTFKNISIISFVGAGVLYAYNIFDGISSEEKVYVENVKIKPVLITFNNNNFVGLNIGISF